jgi:hypothetical protein
VTFTELQKPQPQRRLVQPDGLVADLGEVAVVDDPTHVLVAQPLELGPDLVRYRVGQDGVGDDRRLERHRVVRAQHSRGEAVGREVQRAAVGLN